MDVIVGTKDDLPKAPLFKKSYFELDCIDETVNTTKYLNFLNQKGLLKFHDVGKPIHKNIGHGAYPHNSATVIEIETGDIYVIDSYIYKNGQPPNIRMLESWLNYCVEDLKDVIIR